ncbi:MAG: N-acetylmuramoyl-L-alanine amidase [Bryobacteraceae bacterium]|nr:N-acetylmuramoyl-L-alanine amidase [Bryobacteraceae bacterium]
MRLTLRCRAIRLAAAALLAAAAAAQSGATGELRSVRTWSGADSTRIVVELSRETKWKYGRLSNPERLFFDFAETRPRLGPARIHVIPIDDGRVSRARVALKDTRTTRLVLDLAAEVDYEVSRLTNPERFVVELRLKSATRPADAITRAAPEPAKPAETAPAAAKPAAPQGASRPSGQATAARTEPEAQPRNSQTAVAAPPSAPAAARTETATAARPASPRDEASRSPALPETKAPAQSAESAATRQETTAARTAAAGPAPTAARPASPRDEASRSPALPETKAPAQSAESAATRQEPTAAKPAASGSAPAPVPALPARPTRRGEQSLTRALGLHIGRVVLDPGHGGHDQGTQGPTGLLEKELVLDVALRLGALIEERLGGEVVYTRRGDEFIPLEERTAIANEHRADLFLSIHANSSPVRRVSGAEVFYLNFTTSREALELAARENAGHNRSIFELRELIQKIALKDKLEESREFAGYMQQELSKEWRRLNPAARDRGVKTAPFVVLIGASMPSVLAEIGFVSNPKDEALMKKPEYRQKLAEALYRGVERYARSLGQTQALRAATAAESPQSTR